MKTNYDYVQDYLDVYRTMREKAIEVIKNYGKELDVEQILKKRIMKENGLDKIPEFGTPEWDAISSDYDNLIYSEVYYGGFVTRHDYIYSVQILKVRYKDGNVEVYLHSDDGYIDDWYDSSEVSFDADSVYMTILTFIK